MTQNQKRQNFNWLKPRLKYVTMSASLPPLFSCTTGIYEGKTAVHEATQQHMVERETNRNIVEAILNEISQQSLVSSYGPVQSSDHQFKVAIASSK